MSTRTRSIAIIAAVALVLAGIFYGISDKGGAATDTPSEVAAVDHAIPPIDLAAPADVETATFALG